jgi:hypothetical protein
MAWRKRLYLRVAGCLLRCFRRRTPHLVDRRYTGFWKGGLGRCAAAYARPLFQVQLPGKPARPLRGRRTLPNEPINALHRMNPAAHAIMREYNA